MGEYSNKYKARKPEETISILTKFFNDKNCTLNQAKIWESEINTYSCQYDLIFYGRKILTTYGKGATKIYSIASALGEMYERFCAFPISCWNSWNYDFFQKFNYEKNGFYLDKNEKASSVSKLLNNSFTKPYIENANQSIDINFLNSLFDIKLSSNIQEIPYKNINKHDEKQLIYTNFLLHGLTSGSNGLAAGNTVEEALVQGMSELYERYAQIHFYMDKKDFYFYLNKEIFSNDIKQLIDNIERFGYELKIYDLSYNFNIPVCMIFLINKTTFHYYYHFGAFPVLDIALERCFTEIYQEISSLAADETEQGYTKLYDNNDYTLSMVMHNSIGSLPEIPINLNLINNSKQINKFNDVIFLDNNDYTNEELLNHINKINNLNKTNFFYYDLSLSKDMATVHIISDDFNYTNIDTSFLQTYDDEYKINSTRFRSIAITASKLKKFIYDYCNNPIEDLNILTYEMNNIIQDIPITSMEERLTFLNGISFILGVEYLKPLQCWYNSSLDNNLIIPYYAAGIIDNVKYDLTTNFAKNLIPYEFYYSYCIKNKHNINDFNKIMDFLGRKDNILTKDLSPAEFFKKAILDNIKSIYTSNEYKEFINLFIK